MSVFYDLSKTPRNILNQAIVRAIVSENNGAIFDASDLSTLYQDAAGTIPVTAVEQPVGLMLDKSRGLMLGPELVSNGTFDTDTIWTKQTGWSISTGSARCDGSQVSTSLLYQAVLELGKCYRIEFDVVITAGTMSVRTGETGANSTVTTSGRKTQTSFCVGNTILQIRANVGFVGSIDNVSVKELYGYHATQSITASRPTLSARKNILLATETLVTQSVTTLAATYTLSFTGTGSVTLSGTATGTLTGTGTDRVSLTFTPTAGTLTLTVSGSVTKAQIELGSIAGPYQRVTTATDYDTDERYFKKYLRFDGVDDYLNLPYMGLYAGGSASVVAARDERKIAAVNEYFFNESNISVNQPVYMLDARLNSSISSGALIRNDANTIILDTRSDTSINTGSVNIISSVIDTGSMLTRYRNSLKAKESSYVRSGSLALQATTIGAFNSGITSNFCNDKLYGLIITKSALTDAQRIACERHLSRKSGVQL